MKNIFPKWTMLFLLLAFANAHSEIYSWVDKDGKKHFGEKVPKEYLKQSTELEVKPVNSMNATNVPQAPIKTAYQLEQERRFIPPEPDTTPTQNLSSCERQKIAYQQSVDCYSSCKSIEVEANGQQRNNVSNCKHCVDVKKPDCN